MSDDSRSDDDPVLHAYGEKAEIPTDDCDPVAAILVAEQRYWKQFRPGGEDDVEGSTGRGGVSRGR